jgi:glutaredoxin-like protein
MEHDRQLTGGPMPLLPDDVKKQVLETFTDLQHPVHLVVFTQAMECTHCRDTRELLEEIAELSERIDLKAYDFVEDEDKAKEFGVGKIPATVIMGEEDYGIRFYGIPAGYEFTSLIHTIRMIGIGTSQLDDKTVQALDGLAEPIRMQVFVTPTCPYCPQAVVLSYEMAYASANVYADGVESTEFPHLTIKYQVAGVPRTVINEKTHIEGVVPADMILQAIQETLDAGPGSEPLEFSGTNVTEIDSNAQESGG